MSAPEGMYYQAAGLFVTGQAVIDDVKTLTREQVSEIMPLARDPKFRAVIDHVWKAARKTVTVTQTVGVVPAGATMIGVQIDQL